MFDFIFDILYNLFGWKTGNASAKKLGIWSKVLLIFVMLLGVFSIYYMVKLVSSR